MDGDTTERLVRRILRVNHAGEHGAVAIYSAQIAQMGDKHPDLSEWLAETLEHEQRHRSEFRAAMPERAAKPCRALSAWRIGGAALGRMTALLGPSAVMVCTAAVERTVHAHMQDQARFLDGCDPKLAKLVREIQAEEEAHLAYAEARQYRVSIFATALSAIVSAATETLIAISTRGDSVRLTQALQALRNSSS